MLEAMSLLLDAATALKNSTAGSRDGYLILELAGASRASVDSGVESVDPISNAFDLPRALYRPGKETIEAPSFATKLTIPHSPRFAKLLRLRGSSQISSACNAARRD